MANRDGLPQPEGFMARLPRVMQLMDPTTSPSALTPATSSWKQTLIASSTWIC